MRLMVLVGGFPSLSETFIFHKVVQLARRGIDVEVVARRRGDVNAYRKEMEELPETLRVTYLPPKKPDALAAARLPTMLAGAMARRPAETREWIRYLRERYGNGAQFGRRLFRALSFVGKTPDVLHVEFATMVEEFGDLLTLMPGRKVMSCRGADIDILPRQRPALAAAIREAFEKVDAVHCVSRAMVHSAESYGLDPAKAFINHPSIDWRYFQAEERPQSGDSFTVVTVARLHWKKGVSDALRALKRVHASGIRAHYVLIGEGEDREAIEFDIWDQALSDHVTLTGPQVREAVRARLAEADVFLLPSISEGLSNAALEAMAMRLPIVTTDAGGMAEAVRDGIDGFVVPRRDPEAMARRLIQLAREPDLRGRMGEAARLRVRDRFGIDTQIAIFEEVYRSLAAGGAVPGEKAAACEWT